MKEIERKFNIKSIPDDFSYDKAVFITQIYTESNKKYSIRLREEFEIDIEDGMDLNNFDTFMKLELNTTKDKKYYQTVKSKGDFIRAEYEVEVDSNMFYFLHDMCVKLHKIRFYFDKNKSIDLYLDDMKLFTNHKKLEVEFKDLKTANSFLPDYWYGEEVTGEKSFSDEYLANKLNII